MRILSKSGKFSENYRQNFAEFCVWSGAKVFESCRSRKMLQNAYLDAKIGFDTAENEPSKVLIFFNFSSLQRFNFDRALASQVGFSQLATIEDQAFFEFKAGPTEGNANFPIPGSKAARLPIYARVHRQVSKTLHWLDYSNKYCFILKYLSGDSHYECKPG